MRILGTATGYISVYEYIIPETSLSSDRIQVIIVLQTLHDSDYRLFIIWQKKLTQLTQAIRHMALNDVDNKRKK